MSFVLAFFVVLYSVFILVMMLGWLRLPKVNFQDNYQPKTFISVLIPVRNEAANILKLLKDIESQDFPSDQFEVLVLDDASEDSTAELVRAFQESSLIQVKLLSAENAKVIGKKGMLSLGLLQAKGELIVQTDGDCRVKPDWLRLLEYIYVTKNARFISGPVKLESGDTFFGKMQVTEFASLIGSGAAAIGLGFPNMCNGANLAFEKAAFEAVNGYAGNEKVASGDDEFLMHKIQAKFPGSIQFLKDPAAIVSTHVQKSIADFLTQRTRWASKWKFYNNLPAQVIGLLVFGTNLVLLLGLLFWASGKIENAEFWLWYLLKCTIDFVFLAIVLRFMHQVLFLLYFLPWQLVYLPYVIYCALAGLRGRYQWKGRILNN